MLNPKSQKCGFSRLNSKMAGKTPETFCGVKKVPSEKIYVQPAEPKF